MAERLPGRRAWIGTYSCGKHWHAALGRGWHGAARPILRCLHDHRSEAAADRCMRRIDAAFAVPTPPD